MADDGKRTELICVKVTERMALDLLPDGEVVAVVTNA